MSQAARRVFLLLWAAAALILMARFLRGRFVPVEVAGTSMTPALQPGDYLLVQRGPLYHDPFGHIAHLHGPDGRPLLKRIIGVPGDSLRAGARDELNNRPLREPYTHGDPIPEQYRAADRLDVDE